jgi:hypothetical protein
MTAVFGKSFNREEFEGQMRQAAECFTNDPMYLAKKVNTGHWQSLKGTPHSQTREIQNFLIEAEVPSRSGAWAAMIQPNLPWAEDHFLERVSGEPLNPGEEYKNWPWYKGGVEDHKATGKFSHTYMERYWPKHAEGMPWHCDQPVNHGIRYEYGDLRNIVDLLAREPYTRQAYLPIWFPEDIHAAAVDHQRVPCSLGYHFMVREDRLHCFYPMRSVDFVRYLRDDLYMTGRLMQWVLSQLQQRKADREDLWHFVQPGSLTLFASSCHIFENDVAKIRRDYGLSVSEV